MGLDGVELAMEVEDEFQIRLDDDVAAACRTVSDLVFVVVSELRAKGESVREHEIEFRVREIVADQFGLRVERVRLEDHFVDDLGMD
ncbi:MAG: hypothetical protein AAGI17_07425 [Planctomycetota bacterium]